MPRAKINRKDWRNLPFDQWNVATVHAMFSDLNREYYGVEQYVPWRNWAAERGVIKRYLTQYDAKVTRNVIERAFAEYRPTREFPQLTAGFVFGYMSSRILPQVLAEEQAERMRESADKAWRERREETSVDDVKAWL